MRSVYFVATGLGVGLFVIGLLLWASGSTTFRRGLSYIERPWPTERFIYRHHRIFGGLIVAGAVLVCALFAIKSGAYFQLVPAGIEPYSNELVALARVSLIVFLTAGFIVLPIGLVIYIRPSKLKNLESTANKWIEPGSYFSFCSTFPAVSKNLGISFILFGIFVLWIASFKA